MTSALGGGRSWISGRSKEVQEGSLRENADAGGIYKSENFVDIINGRPLTAFPAGSRPPKQSMI